VCFKRRVDFLASSLEALPELTVDSRSACPRSATDHQVLAEWVASLPEKWCDGD
jgi:hypothetical protein